MDFPFGPLAPDAGEDAPGILMVADGVQPLQVGYGPFPSISVSNTATPLSAAPRGLAAYTKADGTWQAVAGTATTIETKASDDTWSNLGTGFTCTTGDDWCFDRFGTKLLATNTTDGLQVMDVETPAGFSAITAAGKPRWIFECGNMLFALDCLDRSGARDNRLIRSSKFSDHTAWTGVGTDYQPLETGGALIWGGKLSDTTALILQQRAVQLLQVGNVGGGALWGLQTLPETMGAVGAKSVVGLNGRVFWPSTDGFRMYSIGGGIEQIGAGLVDQLFLDSVDQSDMSLIQGTIDPFRKNVLWRYKRTANGSTTVFEDVIGYNWQWRRWFTLTVQTSYIGYSATTGMTYSSFSGTYDDATMTYDSRILQGGQPLLAAMNSSYTFGYFGGAPLAATLETSIANSSNGALVNFATPIDDSADGTLQIGTKDSLSATTQWEDGEAKLDTGDVPIRGRGLNIGFRRNITAGSEWSYAKGVDHVGARRQGKR